VTVGPSATWRGRRSHRSSPRPTPSSNGGRTSHQARHLRVRERAKKLDAQLAEEDIPAIPQRGDLSGADIEGIVGRAWRAALLAGQSRITREILADVLGGFIPSTQTLERELQEIAAILECTDREFLTPAAVKKLEAAGGRERLQGRMQAIKQALEAT
jgi:hypothetical protein